MTQQSGILPIVYLGPTLPRNRANAILDANYQPPIARGDLPARYDGPVVIIDGVFHQRLAVSPKEVLRLVDNGAYVIGASSMGALRAAELHGYGMRGIGWVYESYRSGRILADDEVAVTFAPDDIERNLTVPLVNVRYWLEELTQAKCLDEQAAQFLFGKAKRIFYAERTWQRLHAQWSEAVGTHEVDRLLGFSGGQVTNVKALDAEEALRYAASLIELQQREGFI